MWQTLLCQEIKYADQTNHCGDLGQGAAEEQQQQQQQHVLKSVLAQRAVCFAISLQHAKCCFSVLEKRERMVMEQLFVAVIMKAITETNSFHRCSTTLNTIMNGSKVRSDL